MMVTEVAVELPDRPPVECWCEVCGKLYLIPAEEWGQGQMPHCWVHLAPLRTEYWWLANYADEMDSAKGVE